MKTLNLILLICSLSFINLYGQVDVNTERISIFTDGNSYVEKAIKLTPKNNIFTLKDNLIPKARLGTLLITDKENSVKSIKSHVDTMSNQNLTNTIHPPSFVDLLKTNLNETITIKTKDITTTGEAIEIIGHGTLSHIMIQDKTAYQLIKINDIIHLSFPKKPTIPAPKVVQNNASSSYYNNTPKDIRINLELTFNNSKPKELHMKYLQKGVSWTPFYYLELDDKKKKAKLKFKAEVMNDSEEIKNADLDLIIGVPNFEYSGYLTDLIDFTNLLNPDYDLNSGNSNLNSFQVTAFEVPYKKNQYTQSVLQNQTSFKKNQDFVVYNLKNETLKKNSRAHYSLFEKTLDYRHVYECDLLKNNHTNSIQQEEDNKVFHSIKFVNSTNNLLGEGPVTIIDDTQKEYMPLAQSKLDYVPNEANGLIKITESHEIEVIQKEELIAADQEWTKILGHRYYKVKMKAIIKIENYKDEKIELVLRQEVFGDVEKNSSFNVLKRKEKYYSPNAVNQLEWDLSLNPNEKREITYIYEYFRR